jgi:hypothetical protein
MLRGDLNVLEIVCARAGWGKSTCAKAYHAAGCLTIAYDPGYRLPRGDWTRVNTAQDAGNVCASGGMPAICTGTAMECLNYAGTLAKAGLRPTDAGDVGTPVICVLDESVSSGDVLGQYRLDPAAAEWIMARRHAHVGLIATCQTPTTVHYSILGGASAFIIGSVDPRAEKRLAECGVTDETLAAARTQPKFQFIIQQL